MSNNIATKLQAILSAKGDIKDAIEGKGVTVGSASLDQYASKIEQIPAPIVEAPENDVNFYDYDGFRVASYTIAEAKALTALPTPPTHQGLTFQEWNWTLNDIQNYNRQFADIGANYITSDGKTHIIIKTEFGLDISVAFKLNGTISIDWGDESSLESFTKESAIYQNQICSHSYQQAGMYEIRISYSGNVGYYPYSDNSTLMWRNITVEEIRLGNGATNLVLQYMWGVKVCIHNGVRDLTFLNSDVKQIVVPRNPNFVLSTYQAFSSSCFNISFPKKINNITQSYIFNGSVIGRLVYPEIDNESYVIQNYQFYNTKSAVFSIPDVQFATQANGAFFNTSVLKYIDVPQGWTPGQSMVLSSSTCWTESSIVKFFNKLGTTTNAITLTFGSTNLDKLTAEEKAIATNKGYTLA